MVSRRSWTLRSGRRPKHERLQWGNDLKNENIITGTNLTDNEYRSGSESDCVIQISADRRSNEGAQCKGRRPQTGNQSVGFDAVRHSVFTASETISQILQKIRGNDQTNIFKNIYFRKINLIKLNLHATPKGVRKTGDQLRSDSQTLQHQTDYNRTKFSIHNWNIWYYINSEIPRNQYGLTFPVAKTKWDQSDRTRAQSKYCRSTTPT